MKYNPHIHNRRSIRLKGFDYSQAGAYFVTICVQHRKCLFGDVVDGKMILNDAGKMVQTVWDEIPQKYPGVQTNGFVVMPNHIHGIIGLVGAAPRGRPLDSAQRGGAIGHPQGDAIGHPRGGTMGHPQGGEMGHPQGGAPTGRVGLSPDACGRLDDGHPRDGAIGHPRDGAIEHPRGGAPTVSLSNVVHRFIWETVQ